MLTVFAENVQQVTYAVVSIKKTLPLNVYNRMNDYCEKLPNALKKFFLKKKNIVSSFWKVLVKRIIISQRELLIMRAPEAMLF